MAFQITPSKISPIIHNPIINITLIVLLLPLFYLFGSFSTIAITSTTVSTSTTTNTTPNCTSTQRISKDAKTEPIDSQNLDFSTHHHSSKSIIVHRTHHESIEFCPKNFTNYCPCQDINRVKYISKERFFHRERHCPLSDNEKLRCLVPQPKRYRNPFPWPKSRDMAWYHNVPSKKLTVVKKSQNWVRLEGDYLIFPGGGTSFPKGVQAYLKFINKVLPLKSGRIRTALDIGCGVASFGAALLDYKIITMSVAPMDIHEAQVQFALERGLPAMLDGLYLLEIDRVLRPGGYWVLSGPPIGWRISYKSWERTPEDLENEQMTLEDLARRMCWKKIAEKGPIAVWQKPTNHIHCRQNLKTWKSLYFCKDNEPDYAWYRKMEPCITPLPDVTNIKHTAGGTLEKWPKRLNVVPPRVTSSSIKGVTSRTFNEDNRLWKRRVQHYGKVLVSLFHGGYRNIMDMNAYFGGFAAALSPYPVWVMNVVPYDSMNSTLGIIYERGMIGTYMNWCEAFSTYPRTYDLIHAHGIFSMYMNKCEIVDILIEMYRIVRPDGAVIVRDNVDILVKLKDLMGNLGWQPKLSHTERGPLDTEKVLFVDNSHTTS
ncbi:probable methyltransferase PMT19 isoform X2 [Amaranthus tricolor]|uniref:probable methyltransferase PMT19 isoform X2 n=1 Tax=Amaranthus tricolor TaxID=29722 RepID=UPI0025910CF4|nr:probable methyltransferase PMT19 isoform X2 [Amaranthus tricolor]